MESYLAHGHFDLVTPDGRIVALKGTRATVLIENISPKFVGYELDAADIFFNLKSTLAQLGLTSVATNYEWDRTKGEARIELELTPFGELAKKMLELLTPGAYIGKLFAADPRRRVHNPDYITRMFGRADRHGMALLSLGGMEGSGDLIVEKVHDRAVAFLALRDGVVNYDPSVVGFLPTLAKALLKNLSLTRQLLHLHHRWEPGVSRTVQPDEILLVRTAPLHVRTVYARVVDALLPPGYHHTAASVLQPDTFASGDIYELFGSSTQSLSDIPLEFYKLEPHREHVFFADRDQLQAALEEPKRIWEAFATAPKPDHLAAVFVVKGSQMNELKADDWIVRDPRKQNFPGLSHPSRQALVVERYLDVQPQYPFLKAMEDGLITSQGVLLCRHFPTPLLKRALLSESVLRCLKRIYFQHPSLAHNGFFSHEDRAMLIDLAKFGIEVFWVEPTQILQYVLRLEKETGMFVPPRLVNDFRKATVLGVYGSNLLEGTFEKELDALLRGILAMRETVNHPLLSKDTPLALLTGGGPGAMEVGNRVARHVGILSCANLVDFGGKKKIVNEQKQNAYIDAKMTYRLDRLVERQSEFFLDIPIFLPGGIGMDFEYTLEEVRRKTGSSPATPALLFGEPEYWRRKLTSRFQLNRETGTTKGSEWVSNCFFCIQTGAQGLHVLREFFEGRLKIGPEGPVFGEGFCLVERLPSAPAV